MDRSALNSPDEEIENHVEKIRASGILARSGHLHSLFEYLYHCHINKKTPKELEIAIEGMGREESFDVTQDAVVRVYVHKLRRKLDDFYEQSATEFTHRLSIPKGEYRLALEIRESTESLYTASVNSPVTTESGYGIPALKKLSQVRRINRLLAAIVSILVLITIFLIHTIISNKTSLRDELLWQKLFSDDRPILLVIGDYYIFAESDAQGNVKRLVRDFDVNSPMDLVNYLQLNPQDAEYKFDIALTYLPTSTAYALNKISPVLHTPEKKVQLILASQLTAESLRNSHIVYIGHLSGLGLLSDVVFDVSGFTVGNGGYDELVDTKTGKVYVNNSGIPGEHSSKASHLAYLASFSGPTNNRIITIAGFRDAGLIELTDIVTSNNGLIELQDKNLVNFEAIYETSGFGQATTPAKLITQKTIKK